MKTVTKEETVELEVDLDDFEISDILDYLEEQALTKNQRKQLAEMVNVGFPEIELQSIADVQKFEYMVNVFKKYPLSEIEQKLPL